MDILHRSFPADESRPVIRVEVVRYAFSTLQRERPLPGDHAGDLAGYSQPVLLARHADAAGQEGSVGLLLGHHGGRGPSMQILQPIHRAVGAGEVRFLVDQERQILPAQRVKREG